MAIVTTTKVPKPGTTTPKPAATPVPVSGSVPPIQGAVGGINYNTATAEQKKQLEQQRDLEKNDPAYRQSEIDRTLSILNDPTNAGKDMSAQQRYLSNNLGYVPPPPKVDTPTIPQPQAATVPYPQLTPEQIRQEATNRLAKERAAIAGAVNQTKTSLTDTYNRGNQITQDNRTLENTRIDRTLNPFSGLKSFQEGIIGRERTLADEATLKDYQGQMGAADQKLLDFDTLAPGQEQNIINELTRLERDYGLRVGELTGNFGGQRTIAGQQLDWNMNPNNPSNQGQIIQNQIDKLKLDNMPSEIKQKAELLEQELKRGAIDLETAEFNLKQLQDPNSPVNRVQELNLQMKELEAKNLPERERLELQQLRKQIDNIGKAPYRSEQEVEMDKVKLATMQEQLKQLQNPQETVKPPTNSQFEADVVGKVDIMSPDTRKQFFQNEKQAIINQLGISGYNRLFSQYFYENGMPK